MSFAIPIRRLLALRHDHPDQLLLDYLDLSTIAREPGFISTRDLRSRWRVSQTAVSRRINALAQADFIDITNGHGGYHIHALSSLEAA
jgi:DNA-binding MarR family transcriptional regulator